MCDTCGCGNPDTKYTVLKPGDTGKGKHSHEHESNEHGHSHDHEHEIDGHTHNHDHEHSSNGHVHSHDHTHPHTHDRKIEVEQDVLYKNNLLAERNRGFFEGKNIKAINLVSSPGSGKTSILEKTIKEMPGKINFSVIEGDQQTLNDANRIRSTGAPVIQINTGSGCHLDAEMVSTAVKKLNIPDNSILMIENVGNLVCPALFDLGESHRVLIMSVTEGEDKPVKYPYMFRSSALCIINKTDLLPYVDFSLEKAKEYALKVNPELQFIELSAKTGQGMDEWYKWLNSNL